MAVALLSYHSNFATSEYFFHALENSGQSIVRLGPSFPGRCKNACPKLEELITTEDIEALLFIDPPGSFWPRGFEDFNSPKIAYLIDVHQSINVRLSYAPFFDFVFVAQKDYVGKFHDAGFANTYWLPLACDPKIHNVDSSGRDFEVGFVGKLGYVGSKRRNTLSQLLPRFKTNNYDKFHSPKEMAEVYGRSKIGINASINGDLNMRFFEVMAAGALLITDRIDNGVSDLFEEGIHYVGYSSAGEAITKIEYYLQNAEERVKIAQQGQQEAIEMHTYSERWLQIQNHVYRSKDFARAQIQALDPGSRAIAYAKVYQQLRLPRCSWGVMFERQNFVIKFDLFIIWLLTVARFLNSVVPITPRAILNRIRHR